MKFRLAGIVVERFACDDRMRRIEFELEFDAAGIERHGARALRRRRSRARNAHRRHAASHLLGGERSLLSASRRADGHARSFTTARMTSFLSVTAGTHSLVARDIWGIAVGPLKIAALDRRQAIHADLGGNVSEIQRAGVRRTGKPKGNAQLSLYEASPSVPSADFGSFRASSHSGFKAAG